MKQVINKEMFDNLKEERNNLISTKTELEDEIVIYRKHIRELIAMFKTTGRQNRAIEDAENLLITI